MLPRLVRFAAVVLTVVSLGCQLQQSSDWQASYYDVVPTSLGDDHFRMEVVYGGPELEEGSTLHLRDIDGSLVDSIALPTDGGVAEFTGLTSGTDYRVVLTDDTGEVSDFGFKTYTGTSDLELRYFIDATSSETGMVPVYIHVRSKTFEEVRLRVHSFHTNGQYLNMVGDPSVRGNYEEVTTDSGGMLVTGTLGADFSVHYTCDKGYHLTDNHVAQGMKTEDYLMVSGEQLLIAPDWSALNSFSTAAYGTIMRPSGWEPAVGYPTNGANVFDFKLFENWEFGAVNIYAYAEERFVETSQSVHDTDVALVYEQSIPSVEAEAALDLYRAMAAKWGAGPGDDLYSVMLVDDSRQLYAGEWTTGQGFSTAFGITGEMLVHQYYHRWNAWALGIPIEDEFGGGIWNEGFNEFFCDQVLFEEGYNPDRGYMRDWYRRYRDDVEDGTDQNLVSTPRHELNDPLSVYYKGAVIAFAMDQFIREQTQGQYDLSYCLKRAWQEWQQSGRMITLDAVVSYGEEVVSSGLSEWAETYIVNNTAIVLQQFE